VRMQEFPQTARRIQSDTHLRDLLWGNNLEHTGDVLLQAHVTNAMAKVSERGVRIIKEQSSAKVDACVALAMAALGAVEQLALHSSTVEIAPNPFY